MFIEYLYEPCRPRGWGGVVETCMAPALRELTVTQWHEVSQGMTVNQVAWS